MTNYDNAAPPGIFTIEGYTFTPTTCYTNSNGYCTAEYTITKSGYVVALYQHISATWKINMGYYPTTLKGLAQLDHANFIELSPQENDYYNQGIITIPLNTTRGKIRVNVKEQFWFVIKKFMK